MEKKTHSVSRIPGAEFRSDGAQWLYFGGTSYLGVQSHEGFQELMTRFTREMGTHWGASREGQLVPAIYGETEAALAAWTGSEACITVSSGFLAGRLLADAFSGNGYHCLFSPNCHAALLPARSGRASSWEALELDLLKIRQQGGKQAVLFTDTIDFSDGPRFVVEKLRTLDLTDVILIADDSHGTGVLGDGGRGSFPELRGLAVRDLMVCASMGKALGVTAGLILGTSTRIQSLRQEPAFAGASPAPPAALATFCAALDSGLYLEQFERLWANVRLFSGWLRDLPGVTGGAHFPVFLFRKAALAAFLESNNVLATHFSYAAEQPESPGRIVLTASHSEAHIRSLAKILGAFQDLQ
ncbi:aminotransferase class I/II-fold pyridoxal phosphate-dependent enzyme [Robiginitalea sp. SC105]|uniref:aminotransferase class I/II-fold pyridoxal phosphate-dependent enzyme n=1 Tax=Robiginitalea sp. SC105 TaxID=2762332 RepID=UPI00163A38E2|nr:aminotransferase class I/II-fold pyridoxal phosphate-dependent enzyme [Robiginitalea sp. SC105]MBC2839347.1 pyridoxal phosphate-dependent aminotransferase family protein [Robiginitalea sp. SC105]